MGKGQILAERAIRRAGFRVEGLPRGVYNNFFFEFFNAVFWQSLGSPMVLFIRQSGGSAFAVGLISALPLILMPVTLASARFVERFGYRRTAITFWTLRWILSSSVILIALVNIPGFDNLRAGLALVILGIYHLCRNFGISGWLPWLTLIVSREKRGLYLSRATLFSNLGSVLTFLLVGAILGPNPALATFAIVFGLGTLGGFISSFFMIRIAKIPPETTTTTAKGLRVSFWQSMKGCFAQPGFKSFVTVQSFYGVAFFGIPSLSLIYLREKVGINPSLILYFSTAGVVGASIASVVWGRWIDRRQSVMSLQLLAFSGLCFNSFLWLLLQVIPAGFNYLMAAALLFLSAIWIAALNMSQTHSIMTLAPEQDRVMFPNIATFITYISQALAPMLWGLLLDYLDHNAVELDIGLLKLSAYQIFFAATLVIGIGGVAIVARFLLHSRKFAQSTQR